MEPFALKRALDNVRATTPLVHNITNYVTVNDCANALLAIGASPIMSDEPADVFDITSICGGLTLNIGTLNERSIQGMFAAGERASELGHPIVLDPVGAGASALRTRTASDLLDKLAVSVVRGLPAMLAFAAVLAALFGMAGVWATFPAAEAATFALTAVLLVRFSRGPRRRDRAVGA